MTQFMQEATIDVEIRDRVVGRARSDLTTPALILDLDLARANIERMAERMREMPAELRPHAKVHKSARLARLQVDAGAIGVTTATLWEAMAMARGGIDDILIANEVVGDRHIVAVADLARTARVLVCVDDADNVRALGKAAVDGGVRLGVLVDVDTGMGRCGVRTPDAARALAELAGETDGLDFRGVSGYEGHCMLQPERDKREAEAEAAASRLMAAVDAIGAAGIGCEIVSAGGTGTYYLTGARAGITEIQAGSYAVMDTFTRASSRAASRSRSACSRPSSAARENRSWSTPAGRRSASTTCSRASPAWPPRRCSSTRSTPASRCRRTRRCASGDRVELHSGYAPTTANLYDAYHVVEGGVVTDLWPVEARYGTATIGRATRQNPEEDT